jgi:hypothetical protein
MLVSRMFNVRAADEKHKWSVGTDRLKNRNIIYDTSVNIALALARQAPPMRGAGTGVTNSEYTLVMCARATDRPGCLEYQVHGTRRTCRTGQVSHGRMVWPS